MHGIKLALFGIIIEELRLKVASESAQLGKYGVCDLTERSTRRCGATCRWCCCVERRAGLRGYVLSGLSAAVLSGIAGRLVHSHRVASHRLVHDLRSFSGGGTEHSTPRDAAAWEARSQSRADGMPSR